jgi:hypothetical protein
MHLLGELQFFPHGEIRVASPLPILDTRGHDLTAVEDESALRQGLYSAHLAAMHDFNEPDRRAVELRGYEKAEGA